MTDVPNPPVYRLSAYDKLRINGIDYRLAERSASGYILVRVHEPDIVEQFSVAGFHQAWQHPKFRFFQNFFKLEAVRARGDDPDALLRDLPVEVQEVTIFRADMCDLWLRETERNRDERRRCKRGQPKPERMSLTDLYLAKWLPEAAKAVCRQMRTRKRAGSRQPSIDEPCARTFRDWLQRYRHGDYMAYALRPNPSRRVGNTKSTVSARARDLMEKYATQFASSSRPKARHLWTAMCAEAETSNQGLPQEVQIKPVSWKTFKQRINDMPAFDVMAQREGVEKAWRHFQITREGLFAAYIGEYGQQDDTQLKLMAFVEKTGLIRQLSPKAIRALEVSRPWLGLTIDVASRCIVAARLTATPTTQHAIAGLRLMVSDKSALAASYGCQCPWDQRTNFRALSTDQGANYTALRFKSAVSDLQINAIVTPAASPTAHAHIERFNRTLQNQALAYLDGRTFSNPVERGDYQSEMEATLALDEIESVIIRYIVDVYHSTPHCGLGGETPANAYRRLSQEGLLQPPPDATVRRRALGIECDATLQKAGVRFLGIWYAAPEFDAYVAEHGFESVKLRVDPQDVGTVSVFMNGRWIDATARNGIFHGATLADWEASLDDLSRRHESEQALVAPLVHAALTDIRSTRDYARIRAGFETADIQAARIAAVETRMLNRPAIGTYDEDGAKLPDLFGNVVSAEATQPVSLPKQSPSESQSDDDDGWRI